MWPHSYTCWLFHFRLIWILRFLHIKLRKLTCMIFSIILAQLVYILLCSLSQILNIKLSLLVLLICNPCILNSNLFDPLFCQSLFSLLLFNSIFFKFLAFLKFFSFNLLKHLLLFWLVFYLCNTAITTSWCYFLSGAGSNWARATCIARWSECTRYIWYLWLLFHWIRTILKIELLVIFALCIHTFLFWKFKL